MAKQHLEIRKFEHKNEEHYSLFAVFPDGAFILVGSFPSLFDCRKACEDRNFYAGLEVVENV